MAEAPLPGGKGGGGTAPNGYQPPDSFSALPERSQGFWRDYLAPSGPEAYLLNRQTGAPIGTGYLNPWPQPAPEGGKGSGGTAGQGWPPPSYVPQHPAPQLFTAKGLDPRVIAAQEAAAAQAAAAQQAAAAASQQAVAAGQPGAAQQTNVPPFAGPAHYVWNPVTGEYEDPADRYGNDE